MKPEDLLPKHIVLDFDNTLAHFEGGREGLFKIFIRFGIEESTVREAYEEAKKEGGFNVEKLINKIKEKTDKRFDEELVRKEFTNWLNESLKLYADARDLLSKIREAKMPFSIVSAGDRNFQEEKVKALGINPDDLYVVPQANEKSKIIRELLGKSEKLIYIDDKATELDAIKRDLEDKRLVTIRINRKDSPYKDQVPEFKHEEISSLSEVEI